MSKIKNDGLGQSATKSSRYALTWKKTRS